MTPEESKPLVIHGVRLPVDLSPDFVTPDFAALMDFYPEYRKQAGAQRANPRAYLFLICEQLAAAQCREGRDFCGWVRRIDEHFGAGYITAWARGCPAP